MAEQEVEQVSRQLEERERQLEERERQLAERERRLDERERRLEEYEQKLKEQDPRLQPPAEPHPVQRWKATHREEIAKYRGRHIAIHPERGIIAVGDDYGELDEILTRQGVPDHEAVITYVGGVPRLHPLQPALPKVVPNGPQRIPVEKSNSRVCLRVCLYCLSATSTEAR